MSAEAKRVAVLVTALAGLILLALAIGVDIPTGSWDLDQGWFR